MVCIMKPKHVPLNIIAFALDLFTPCGCRQCFDPHDIRTLYFSRQFTSKNVKKGPDYMRRADSVDGLSRQTSHLTAMVYST